MSARETDRDVPLSHAQRGLWFIDKLEGPSATYNVPVVFRLLGELDACAVSAALDDVVARHESLRTVFVEVAGQVRQRVLPAPVGLLDTTAGADLAEVVRRPFDLAVEPPMRGHLLRTGPGDHLLVLLAHHIACDGWSVAPLLGDLTTAYRARLAGRAPDWSPLPVRYTDFSLWQHELLGSPEDPASVAGTQLAFWRAALADLPDELALPVDRVRPAVATYRGAVVDAALDADAHRRLVDLARERGCTPFTALQAAVAVVLTRLGAGTDIPLGVPVAGRTDAALDDLVGFFVNTVVLRVDTSGDPGFARLLDRVRAVYFAALEHQDVPFDMVVEALNPPRSTARHPVFQVLVSANNGGAGLVPDLPGVTAAPVRQDTGTAKFDLSFDFEEHHDAEGRPAGIGVAVEYATDLFDAVTARSIAERLVRLLAAAADDPDLGVRALPVLLPGEQRRLAGWQGPRVPEEPLDLRARVHDAARARPDAVAVSGADTRYTWAELAGAVDRTAGALRHAGAGEDSLTAVVAHRDPWFVATALGVLASGSGYLAVDAALPAERIRRMVVDSGARFLLPAPGFPVESIGGVPAGVTVPTGGHAPPGPTPGRESLAYAVFTSGSTGRPKGVLVPHRGLANHLRAVVDLYGLTPADTMAFNAPLTFDVAVWQALTMPAAGGRVHVLDDDTTRDPLALLRAVADHGVTVLQIVPQVLRAVLDMWDVDDATVPLAAGLRWMLVHGEELRPDLVARWYARHPAVPMANVYGPAECSDDVSISVLDTAGRRARVPIGAPLRNTDTHVLDEFLAPVPIGVAGELYVGGAGVARGYAGLPALTATRFVPDPFGAPGTRLYRTGDLARWHRDGELEFLGRTDHQVKVRGMRVEPGEVQAVLARDPQVRQAFLVAADGGLVAYVVPAADGFDPVTARALAARVLPEYLLPSAFVVLPELPVTANGKVDRAALPPPDAPDTGGRAPRTPAEHALCAVFAEVLGVPEVGIDDSFFALGGHSLLAMRLISRVRAVVGAEIGITALFESPTVAGLLGATDRGGSFDVLLPLRPGRDPVFCVHPATGLAWTYGGLAAHLPGGLYGLQAPGLAAGTTPPATAEEMLDRILAEIRAVQPTGPYRLLGWSLGGNIAHALAVRLRRAGEAVALLALVDAYPADVWPYPDFATPAEWDEYSLLATLTPAEPEPDMPALLARLRDAARERLGLDAESFARLVAVGVNSSRLVAGHDPGFFDGAAIRFTATRGDKPDPAAWQRYVDRVDGHELDCRHEEAMDPEPRRRVAEVVAAALHRKAP